jgi:hypothetical protein
MAVFAIATLAFLCAFPAFFSKDIGVGGVTSPTRR